MKHLVESDEHERAAFASCGRRFEQKELRRSGGIGTGLHRALAQLVGCRVGAPIGHVHHFNHVILPSGAR